MIDNVGVATFAFIRSIKLSLLDLQQVNDLSVIGRTDKYNFKVSFSDDFSIACFMLYTYDGVNVQVYKLENGKYRYFVHA